MTCWGQRRKETSVPTTLMSTGTTTNIGTWNIKIMYEAGKVAKVSAEMRRYTLLRLSETRWLQAGQLRLATDELLLYSRHEDEKQSC
jgi:hypothetical protein